MALYAHAAPAEAPGESGKLFDWGRPCTLVGNSSEVEITGKPSGDCLLSLSRPKPQSCLSNVLLHTRFVLLSLNMIADPAAMTVDCCCKILHDLHIVSAEP